MLSRTMQIYEELNETTCLETNCYADLIIFHFAQKLYTNPKFRDHIYKIVSVF